MAPELRRLAPLPPRIGLICRCGWVLTIIALAAAALPCTSGNSSVSAAAAGCDLFRGRWVADKSYPLYDASACPFVPDVFDCRRNGRPDDAYLKFRWTPANCRLPRFDGADLLRRLRGKTVMFVGDSLSMNQWVSLACMLHAAAPAPVRATLTSGEPVSSVRFEDYDLLLVLYHTTFLVDVVQEDIGRVLKLDSMRNASAWLGAHLLVFNTWHWWTYRGASQVYQRYAPPLLIEKLLLLLWTINCSKQPMPCSACRWDYVQDGNSTYRDMDRLTAFSKGLSTWARWVDANIDASKTRVFYQGISPSHYMSKQQEGEAGAAASVPATGGGSCLKQTRPLQEATDAAGGGTSPSPEQGVVRGVIGAMASPVALLDITALSQLRIDAHPSVYAGPGRDGMDCTHWCIAGLPDAWNQIMYAMLLQQR
ncbi:Protein trichome birefringence-like 38 [Dichanthelium oligosanthes]|uniref:Protein trichome birefringence-like 38 n=1 Tax=Dichanthelium oligosanthes TaxID=888268 RepID=A0A1E5W0Y3_9POAL|nr:Protein trichome birefringence-like 38 [Dichanthelium oligosanthes]